MSALESGPPGSPTASGSPSATASRSRWASYGAGPRPTVLLMPTWTIVALADLEGAGRLPGPALPGGHLRRPGQRPVRPAARRGGVHRRGSTPPTPSRCSTPPAPTGPCWSACPAASTWALHVAAEHPDRVLGIVAIGAAVRLRGRRSRSATTSRLATPDTARTEGWAKYNRHYWLDGGYDDFVRFFFGRDVPRAALDQADRGRDRLGARDRAARCWPPRRPAGSAATARPARPLEPLCALVRCPVLVIHGTDDRVRHARDQRAAGRADRRRAGLLVDGAGHGLPGRDPVLVNRLIRDVRRAGCARARRDRRPGPGRPAAAAARALPVLADRARPRPARRGDRRRAAPAAPGPADRLAGPASGDQGARGPHGERVHPASAWLANESAHIEAECRRARPARVPGDPADGRDPGQQLHGLRRRRRARSRYDLVIGDEAWDVDHFLHENPELKRSAFAWLTDFVGWLPMPTGGEREAALTADYNAEMLEQRARLGRCGTGRCSSATRTTSSPDEFGPGLPSIRDWTRAQLRLRRLRDRLRPGRAGRPGRAAAPARLPAGRAGLPGQRRRLRGRAAAAAPARRRGAAGPPAGARTCASSWSPARASTRRRCPAGAG